MKGVPGRDILHSALPRHQIEPARWLHRERARQSLQDLWGFHLETKRRRHPAKKSRGYASYIFIETGIFLTGTKREKLASEVTELREAREKPGRSCSPPGEQPAVASPNLSETTWGPSDLPF